MHTDTNTQTAAHPHEVLVAVADLRPHERTALIPAMDDRSFRAFRVDIERRGLLVPLDITAEKVVLDGVARLRAARELGIPAVPVRVVAPEDEVEYRLLAAIERRQLTASQRAALAVELEQHQEARATARQRQLANLKNQMVEVATLPPQGKTREKAAAWAGVSPRTVCASWRVRGETPAQAAAFSRVFP